ncbi:hypothetical protein BABINDRAFT_163359 [Babjeviella inositovora NRRL Y-12698]|uniref:Replication factor C subunit 1 n=1 Tax=Babjeviella inositovora NRRL Y-12698 TaxID=984486 RepID=A0A1E3QKM6_9ASCO|nr:uncharacterized protein BABINDRAFT_163359 [Babjeviella inositovora NRRL Y-12698]ODQ77642.1 hypothetical protein BABINDRAFT_163359 [Babjeviella inositovora NRRL Y-12698]
MKAKPKAKPKAEPKSKRRVIESDSEDDMAESSSPPTPPTKQQKTEKLEPTDAAEYFGARSTRTRVARLKPLTVVSMDSDEAMSDASDDFKPKEEDFDDFDDDFDDDDVEMLDVIEKKYLQTEPAVLEPNVEVEPAAKPVTKPVAKAKPAAKPATKPVTATTGGVTAEDILLTIPNADLPEDEDTTGKSFRDFKARQATLPQPLGETPLPEGSPNCLNGLTMVFTGVLPTLERDAAEALAKRYGAKVTKSISGKTSVVVLGDEAGPSKVKKIKSLKIKAITEDGFIQLIRGMPIDGGDGEAAQKTKQKREKEEAKIIAEAVRVEAAERAREEEEAAVRADAARASLSVRAEPARRVIPSSEKLWTTKYAPTDLNQLCGNKGSIAKLRMWLTNWSEYAKADFKDPGPDGSGVFRACLISGPPGIGKTSAAHLVAKSLGYDVLEKNASDVRSKSLLHANLKDVLSNTSVVGFFSHNNDVVNANNKKFCVIMDEVDGMSSGDRGGAGQLSAFCRVTKMPMILICNDRLLPKMRTFDRTTLDIPFRRPDTNAVKGRLMTIAHREGISLDPNVIGQLVECTHNDIRQMINLLSTVSKTQKAIGFDNLAEITKLWAKHVALQPFEITGRLLSGGLYHENSQVSLNSKIELYFNDIEFTPIMMQENYLNTRPARATSARAHLELVTRAADSISESDIVNSLIRSGEQQWSLLPFHAVMSSVRPGSFVAGNVTSRINFAGWLGQNSRQMKFTRILQELQYHTRLRTSTDKTQLRLEYLPALTAKLTHPLLANGLAGIDEVIETLDHYYLSKEDWDYLIEMRVGTNNILNGIPAATKSGFTRKYNSMTHPVVIYKTGNSVAAARSATVDYEDVVEDDTAKSDKEEEEESDDKIDFAKDKLIKQGKPKKKAVKAKKAAKKAK